MRVIAVERATAVRTSLAADDGAFELELGASRTLRYTEPFELASDAPVSVMLLVGGQATTGVPSPYPGGDPAMTALSPIEQHRRDAVVLVPEGYAFDYVLVTAPLDARVAIGDEPAASRCTREEHPGVTDRFATFTCALSSPVVQRGGTVLPGIQRDGVLRIASDRPVGIYVYGFDRYISYAYLGALDLVPLR